MYSANSSVYELAQIGIAIDLFVKKDYIHGDINTLLEDISSSVKYGQPGIMIENFNFGLDFSFGNYHDRVVLGQASIDQLHKD